jgi:hypothetical protein
MARAIKTPCITGLVTQVGQRRENERRKESCNSTLQKRERERERGKKRAIANWGNEAVGVVGWDYVLYLRHR